MAVDRTTISVADWDSDSIDAAGVEWTLTDLTGWWEPPGVKDNAQPRPVGPGAFDAPVYDDVRVLGFEERITAPDPQKLHQALIRMGKVRRLLMAGTQVIGHQPDGDYYVTAKAGSTWQTAAVGNSGWLYQWSATCRDPYKYGPAVQLPTGLPTQAGGLAFPMWAAAGGALDWGVAGSSGRITLLNPGSVDAYPVYTVQGPLIGGFSIGSVDLGNLIIWADDVPVSATVVVDAASGRGYFNGADWTGSLTSRQWWSVPAGGGSTIQFAARALGQSGTLTAVLRPPYY
jgi:hypothetical protein